ncbi:Uncharacterised protein [Yersinia pekkanenii]|uniref:Uncharacterized protein n=2 Tax=Yersinia pekkanenii TaxID=1288385 RepID=A0A0T9RJY4_9GAMM|nr:Uncharacterised protein [Yersinia pekkanenii]HEN3647502.1 hypothetical protein [Yersinia enterocolitica]
MNKEHSPARRLSALQKNILIILAALNERKPGPVPTKDLEKLLTVSDDKPVYGPNLRGACHRLAKAGMVRTLRASNLQLAVELTHDGLECATLLYANESQAEVDRQKRKTCLVLPHNLPTKPVTDALPVMLNGQTYYARSACYVVPFDGTPYLMLLQGDGLRVRLYGDTLSVGRYYLSCFDAGLPVHVQINEEQ